MSSAAECDEFRDLVLRIAHEKQSHYYYSAELPATPVAADPTKRTLTVRTTLTSAELTGSGCIDEGVAATVADYWTSALLTAVHGGKSSVTTSLSVQAPRRVAPGTPVDVVCSALDHCGSRDMPCATALFVAAEDHLQVFAVATHTKYFKPLRK
ncbi:hypothetical protein IW150_006545 [Coemansia sp. RSA 2607]|nr:hypothetical protein IW150_006545 [Coemansia sp. RSA 2607]KAJ2384611.1 hypothetical protein GGI05_004951 [Coemansia sp. RSA 2603]